MGDASTVEDLQPGDHACLTFSDPEERLDIVAAFIRDGLKADQRVLCLTEAISERALLKELARRGLAVTSAADGGQLTVTGSAQMFLPDGTFAATRMLDELQGKIDRARQDGYQGLRITSDMCWALRPVQGVAELMDYESRFATLLAEQHATAVCQYDRQCFDTVTLASTVDVHAFTVAAVTYHDDALLRICRQHVPTGVRVAGEIDYRAVEPLSRALTEALALDDHIEVNLVELRFIDAVAAGVLMQAATGMAPRQRMTIRCRRLVHRVLQALGAHEVSGVRTVAIRDDD
jgi:anti-anti-sigma factor